MTAIAAKVSEIAESIIARAGPELTIFIMQQFDSVPYWPDLRGRIGELLASSLPEDAP
jgi:hypothetical protein